MANLPDPIGKVVRDLGMVRGEARTAFLRLPAADPLRAVLDQVDKILGDAETNIGKASQKITGQVTHVTWFPLALPPTVTGPASLRRWAAGK